MIKLYIFLIYLIGLVGILTSMEVHDTTNLLDLEQPPQYPPFGRSMRQEFFFYSNYINLNHGAYGSHPKVVKEALNAYALRAEANPDLWMRRDAKFELALVRSRLAQFVNAPSEDIVMVPNTTSGINAIFRSMLFNFGERILHFSTIYNSMNSIIQYICDTSKGGVSKVVFNLTYPLSDDQLVQNFEIFLNEIHDPSKPIRIALIDHITSIPGIIVPIERLIPMLKQRGILVLVDGAHAIGQIPIDVTALAPDYYITNCHKWLFAARGAALLYVDKKHQGSLHPAHINSGYSNPAKFQDEFFWTGTMDYSPYMTVTAALEFRKNIGGESKIQEYNHKLAVDGGNYLAERFETVVLQEESQIGGIVDIQLPLKNPLNPILTDAFWYDLLMDRFQLFANPHKHGDFWWLRVSAQIYNDLSDFEVCAQVFLTLCQEIDAGKFEIN